MYSNHYRFVGLAVFFAALISIPLAVSLRNRSQGSPKTVDRLESPTVTITNGVNVTRLATEVEHGLSLVQVNDSINLLIYRGVESVSMIQIK